MKNLMSVPLPEGVYLIHRDAPGSPDRTAATMGNKAWRLDGMARLGLNVPEAVVVGTRYCELAESLSDLGTVLAPGLRQLEACTGLGLGHRSRPLLLSVRSGAPVSMPGMMETLLNIGLSDLTLPGVVALTGNPRLAWDAYRRLIAGFGEVVDGLPASLFEEELARIATGRDEQHLDFMDLRLLTQRSLAAYRHATGHVFPQEPVEQLEQAVRAVFRSWHAPKAREYRLANSIADDIGTAVTLQRMVFGNSGGLSGAGVGFTRHPATGECSPWVDFLRDAQGEDVVSGRRRAHGHEELARLLPAVWEELAGHAHTLESAFRDMQDFEFTVQDGRLFMLQTRSGKRTPLAALRIALDLHDEGLLSVREVWERIAPIAREDLRITRLKDTGGQAPEVLATADSACTGVASGVVALDEAAVHRFQEQGLPVILVRPDADTADIAALRRAEGLLTHQGARTAHAAVVARQLGKVCLVGCRELAIDLGGRRITFGGITLAEGDWLTLDGHDGQVIAGRAGTQEEWPEDLLSRREQVENRFHQEGVINPSSAGQ